jgi:bifunctional DNase/RNase
MQIENVTPPRPMTHDLLRLVIAELRAQVQRVVVTDLKDSTFYALIYLDTGGTVVAIDARPSDAIALALRTKAPIFVDEAVLTSARSPEAAPDRAEVDRMQKWLDSLDPDDLGKYKM